VAAIAYCEAMRPLFVRWAADAPRVLYARIMAGLWATPVLSASDAARLRAAIASLPESEYDDSHHRDFFVMRALGVLHQALTTMSSPDPEQMKDLDYLFEHLVLELEVPELHADLRAAILGADTSDRVAAASRARELGGRAAARVDAALTATARERGWPAERMSVRSVRDPV
jgi:hypothetical protein